MNKCIFVGRTTKDAEIRYTAGNEPVAIASTSIAIDDGYGDRKKTSFFNITIFGKRAEAFEKYVPKGTKVALVCRAQQDTWEKDGVKRTAVKFVVDEWEFAQSKEELKESEKEWRDISEIDEDLPFN